MKSLRKIIDNEILMFFTMAVLCLAVFAFPLVRTHGLEGFTGDMMYHLLRIEGIKTGLVNGEFPVRIYTNYLNGYGYGTSFFYPDVFFYYPAILRLLGINPIVVWKIFLLTITFFIVLTTYFSLKYIIRSSKWAIAGTFLIVLSQIYLAESLKRVGISEYLAYIFMPILMAGIYDLCNYKAKRAYLIGIGMGGLLLSHTIMTFLGFTVSILIIVLSMVITKSYSHIFNISVIKKLIVTAAITFFAVSGYFLPLLEQMISNDFIYKHPWANISDHVQPFYTLLLDHIGYFDEMIAYICIGMPIFFIIGLRLVYKPDNKYPDLFLFLGLFIYLATTVKPLWKILSHTIFNMIQFPYRLYPYALFCVVLGLMLLFSEKVPEARVNTVIGFIVATSLFWGIKQSKEYNANEITNNFTEQTLIDNSNYIARGEWLPYSVDDDVKTLTATDKVLTYEDEIDCDRNGSSLVFESKKDVMSYTVPLVYYKGYSAKIVKNNRTESKLKVSQTDNGLVAVENEQNYEGTVTALCVIIDVSEAKKFLW